MSMVEVVEKRIKNFSPRELAQFRLWFSKYDSDAWDAQIEADARAGRFDSLAKEAIVEYEAGKVREL